MCIRDSVHAAQSALQQDYPQELHEVVVIADRLQPATLAELRRMPIRVLEASFENSSKARALNFAVGEIGPDGAEAVAILDADNLAGREFIARMNDALDSGIQACLLYTSSFSIPLDEIFNRRNKIKQQKKRIENTQYDLDRWYDELRMKIIDAYTTAVEQLSILRSAAEAKITSEAQYRMTEVDFVKGKLDAQTLSRQKSLENSATREYEQVRRNLNDALLRLEILTHTPIINKPISMPGVSKEAPETE